MKILVTGGCGFIGSALCLHIINETDADLVNLDKLTYAANPASLASIENDPRYTFVRADICDADGLREILATHQPEVVIHLAAESHVDRSITGAREFLDTNIMGTFSMLEAAREYWSGLPENDAKAFRFLHVSTDEVYGSLGDEGLFREDTAYDPSSPYSASKAASDHLVMAWHRTYGLPTLISNCSNNYGPRQFPEKLIPLMIISAMHGQPLPVYGDGSNVRDWLHVEDHVRALLLIAQNGEVGRTYNVGGRNERSNLQVVHALCDTLDELHPDGAPHADLITFVTDRPGHDQRYAIDANRLEGELGWRAQETFETGMASTIAWYLENEDWWRPLVDAGDVGARLGLPANDSDKG